VAVGFVAREATFEAAFVLLAAAFLLAGLLAQALPETRGTRLT
jgi:hypothetical protein